MNNLYMAPVCEMKNFSNLFIEMTAKNCNQKCKNCYIDFPLTKNIKDFISGDLVKMALNDTIHENLECIYLVGAEPMTHPDFNAILRLCLKRSNVCIFTNGSFINEKKARFLKKLEDESDYEIIFQLSLSHYDELKNDEVRSRGSFRQVMNAAKSLSKYDFNPILCVTDYYNVGAKDLINGMQEVFSRCGLKVNDNNFKINRWINKLSGNHLADIQTPWNFLDCEYGRILTIKGVYTCPFLANDHRGRSGCDFTDFSRKNSLETGYCIECIKNKNAFFSIDYSKF